MKASGSDLRLVGPDQAYERSVRSFIREVTEAGEGLVPWVLAELEADFSGWVMTLQQQSEGRHLRDDQVAHSTFLLVDASDEVLAVSNLRHRLNGFLSEVGGHIGFGVRPGVRRRGYGTAVLRLTLAEARAIGIGKVFITCDKGNVGSEKSILNNGGIRQDEIWSNAYSRVVQRFWIEIVNV